MTVTTCVSCNLCYIYPFNCHLFSTIFVFHYEHSRHSLCVSLAFQIRRQMIDGKSGQRKIKTLIKSVDEASHQYMKLNHDPK